MDLETTQTNAVARLPLLKQGEYEMWRLRIEQYFQIQDYALWDIIFLQSCSQNMAFVSTSSNTNEVNTTNVQVSTANSSVSIASTYDNTANLSDVTVYVFLANQPNGSQLVHEDLE
ncbi:hypothetical protein Tco_0049883 [Tanacetum coccineum]